MVLLRKSPRRHCYVVAALILLLRVATGQLRGTQRTRRTNNIKERWAPQNEHLAQNPYNNIHNDQWFTDTYVEPGPFNATSANVRIIEKFLFNDPITGKVHYMVLGECGSHTFDSDGNMVTGCAGLPDPKTKVFSYHIVTIDSKNGNLLAYASFPSAPYDDFHQALTDFSGLGYFHLDNQDRVVMGMPNGHVVTWERQESDKSKVDMWSPIRSTNINGVGGPVPEDRGKIYALLPSEGSGHIWFTTTGGIVGTIAPESWWCTNDCVKWIDINDHDQDGILDLQPDGGFQNITESHSVDGNSTYQQSDYFMYRFDLDENGAPKIGWQIEYDRGERKKPGQTSRGSGTSPSFFKIANRNYVTIMDNAITPHINVYRTELELLDGEDRLLASIAPFGDNLEVSNENSLVVYPGPEKDSVRIYCENNWGNTDFLATAGTKTTSPGVGGIEVGGDGLARALSSNELISVPSVVSKASIGAGTLYTYEKRELGWWLTALDADDLSTILWSVRVGSGNPMYNNWYSQLSLAPDSETFYVGIPEGLLQIRPSEGPPPPQQCSSLMDAQQAVTLLADLGNWIEGPTWAPDYTEASMVAFPDELARLRDGSPKEAIYQRNKIDQMISDLALMNASLASADYDVTKLTPQQKQALREFAEEYQRLIIELFLFWAIHCADIELNGDIAKNFRILLFRSYLPTNGFDSVVLPDITLVAENGTETPLPLCSLRADNADLESFYTVPDVSIVDTFSGIANSSGFNPNNLPAPWCAWWGLSSVETLNIASPDENAAYWYMPLIAGDNVTVLIDGEYQDSRYMSLALYSQTANPYDYGNVSSTIPDYLIFPNSGFDNPWQVNASPGGEFRVTIKPEPKDGEKNVLPWYTTYPNSTKATMPVPCGHNESENVACPLSNMFISPPLEDETGIFSNVNVRYLMNIYDPSKLYVLRGKLPSTPNGTHPVPWPDAKYDLRYFSICNLLYERPYPAVVDNGCAVDYEIPTDGDGTYTIVYSTEANRPVNANLENGIAWIKATPEIRNMLVMRHMLPTDGFEQAAQNVPTDASWQSAFSTMGEYYPATSVTCSKAAFEDSPSKCWVPAPPQEKPAFVSGATVSA